MQQRVPLLKPLMSNNAESTLEFNYQFASRDNIFVSLAGQLVQIYDSHTNTASFI